MMARRWLLLKAGAGVIFLVVFFSVMEFSIRLAVPEYNPATHLEFSWRTPGLILGQPGARKRQIKNTGDFNVEVRFNQYGLRDSEDLARATSHDFIIVGDSFVFGWGVEEQQRVGEQLAALIGRQVFNVAVPGDLDTYDKLISYALGKCAQPPRVILAVSLETDVATYSTVAPETSATPQHAPWLGTAKVFLTQHSAVYFLLTQQIHQTQSLRDIAVRLGLIDPNLQHDAGRLASDAAVAATAARVVDIATRNAATVVLLPSRYIWFGDNQDALSRTHDTLADAIHTAGVNILDLKQVFEADGQPLHYHFEHDGHWRPEGHAKAAAALARHLKERYGNAL